VLEQNLSLIEIKTRLKEFNPAREDSTKQVLVDRMAQITKQMKKSTVWSERRKNDRITKLLDELEKLIGEG